MTMPLAARNMRSADVVILFIFNHFRRCWHPRQQHGSAQ
jgi:hypothetical protein